MDGNTVPFRILLAVDGSEHAYAALRLIRDLPLTDNDVVDVVSVMIPRHASDYWAHETVLKRSRAELESTPAKIKTEVLTGNPAEQILERAAKHKPDLIALGAQGLRATLGFLLGGVAQQVVEHAEQPVLIAHAPYNGLRQALIGVDTSPFTSKTLDYLHRFPFPDGLRGTLLHVLPPELTPERLLQTWPVYPGEELVVPQLSDEDRAALKRQAEEEVARGEKLLKDLAARMEGVFPVDIALRRGDAATELIEQAREMDADLVVTAHRGESGITRWLLGSVARKIAYHAPHAALIVK